MYLTKFGHCCLLIEENDIRILTDPGKFSTEQNEVTNVDALIITHEHSDHFHVESVKKILEKNPSIRIITNKAVGALLSSENISSTCVEDGETTMIGSLTITGSGSAHAIIYPSLPFVENTGYFIGERLFYPGDAFHLPGKEVDILALPVAGPWLKFSEAIDYARAVHPKTCIPVHDGVLLKHDLFSAQYSKILKEFSIDFLDLPIGEKIEY